MTFNKKKLNVSVEAIAHQRDTRLFRELTLFFTEAKNIYLTVKKEEGYKTAVEKVNAYLSEVNLTGRVKELTGINTSFTIVKDKTLNAYVIPPDLTDAHPLLANDWRQGLFDGEDALKEIKSVKDKTQVLMSGVDRKNVKITGAFSNILIPIFIHSGILDHEDFSGDMIAAIYSHELGHAWSWFELSTLTVTTNQIIEASKEAFTDGASEINVALFRSIGDTEYEKGNYSKEETELLFVKSVFTNIRSEYGQSYKDGATSEIVADQFVARLGGGRAMAKALDMMHREYGQYTGSASHIFSNLCGIFATVFFSLATYGIVTLILLLIGDPLAANMTYEQPVKRIESIKHQLIDRIKDRDLPVDQRRQLVEEIKYVDQLMDGLKDRTDWLEAFWGFISPKARRLRKAYADQHQLERLLNNDLHYVANQLETSRA